MKTQLIKNLSEMLSDSTAYGVPKLFRSKRLFYKLFWLAFILMGSGASVYYIWDAINSYYDYEVITKIESVYEQPMLFPTISFCPYTQFFFDNKSLTSILKQCSFNLDQSCQSNPDKYFERFKTFRGDCFRFNSGKNMSGQAIPFFYSTIGGKDDSFYIMFSSNIGIQLWVHLVSLPPKFGYYSNHLGNTILLTSNAETQLVLNKIVEKRLGLPYNPCYHDDELSGFPGNKTIINYIRQTINETYKQTNCLELCFDVYYINENPCSCQNTSIGNVWQDCFVIFERMNLSGCTYTNKSIFYKQSIQDKCKDYCPFECDSIRYSVNSYSTYRAETRFCVYFESLKYTLISQIQKEKEFDLLSNIGGILGLFIGVSFVTLFEIGELLIEILLFIFKRKNNNKTVQVAPIR